MHYNVQQLNIHTHLLRVHLLAKFHPPELQSLVKSESYTLEKQPILKASKMLQVVFSAKRFMKVAHARWERLLSDLKEMLGITSQQVWDCIIA
jgi:tRNA/tmRNA/rRNA uracil-C5-methylase (TrmA/RlmC/RlmD family)